MFQIKTFDEFINEMDISIVVQVNNDTIENFTEKEAKDTLKKICYNISKLVEDNKINYSAGEKIFHKLPADDIVIFVKKENHND